MKANITTQLILALGIVLLSSQAQARIFRVNNRLATSAPQFLYNTLLGAHDAASTGDTVLVEGSPTAYDESTTLSKRLVIFGPGYYLAENAPKQANPDDATFSSYLIFNVGSQGSVVAGLRIRVLYIGTDNITVTRCHVYTNLYLGYTRSISNTIITQNWVTDVSNSYGVGNAILNNNIVGTSVNLNVTGSYIAQFNSVSNNIFFGQNITIRTSVFQNNILTYNQNNFVLNIVSGSILNNVCAASQLGVATGNRDYDPAANNLFVGLVGANNSPDGQYRLLANSPYIAAGVGGTQPGIYGGATPYELSGLPPIPAIYEITTTGTGSAQSGLPITIKIKSY